MVSVMKVDKAPLESYDVGVEDQIQETRGGELPLTHPELYYTLHQAAEGCDFVRCAGHG